MGGGPCFPQTGRRVAVNASRCHPLLVGTPASHRRGTAREMHSLLSDAGCTLRPTHRLKRQPLFRHSLGPSVDGPMHRAPPAGLEPAASGLRVRRHSVSTTGACEISRSQTSERRPPTCRCRLCRRRPHRARSDTTHRSKSSWLGEAEPDFDRRKLRWQGSNLRFAINSRASYRSTTPE